MIESHEGSGERDEELSSTVPLPLSG